MKLRLFIVSFAFCALLWGCHKPETPRSLDMIPLADNLVNIDSLMWSHPDSALIYLVSHFETFTATEPNRHYANLLLAELLYKNYLPQENRTDLLQAVTYFDSLLAAKDTDTQGVPLPFLSARAHYINGTDLVEHDSAVSGCKEYIRALEIIETHFPSSETPNGTSIWPDHLPRFIALTYNRLGELFSFRFMQKPTINCYKKALVYFDLEPTSPYDKTNSLRQLGLQYNELAQFDSADYYYSEALRLMPDTNNVYYRDIASHKAMLSYNMGNGAKPAINDLRRIMAVSEPGREQLRRMTTIGSIYFFENQYDSALVYITPAYEAAEVPLEIKISASYLLHDIYKSQGDTLKAAQYALYQAENLDNEGMGKTENSILNDLFQNHLQWEQEKDLAEKQQTARQQKNKTLIALVLLVAVAAVVAWLLHRRKMQAEREAHRMEKASMLGRLKRSNEELRELKDQIPQQNHAVPKPETQAASFTEEPICRLIMERVNEGQFKSKVNYLDYKEYALSKEQITALREAVDRHFGQFTIRLSKAYPDLTKSDLSYCCLYLLDLNDADIAALMQRAYSTVSERSRKLKVLFGSEEPLSTILRGLAAEEQFL